MSNHDMFYISGGTLVDGFSTGTSVPNTDTTSNYVLVSSNPSGGNTVYTIR